MSELTQARLKELLDYDPQMGVFCRRVRMANCAAGTIAGCRKRIYMMVSVDDILYRAHRLAFLWMLGRWPKQFVDHIDMDKHNNAWSNLREATKSQNQANNGLIRTNKSGFKGVSRYRAGDSYGKSWQAGISKDGKRYALGHFSTPEEAHQAYVSAAHEMFGEFARAK